MNDRPSNLILIVLVLFLVVLLLYLEYTNHDCMRGKKCTHRRPDITEDDSPDIAIEKVIEMVQSNNSLVFWRQALLVGIILPFPLIYLLYGRLPTFLEWLFVGLIIFLAVYLSYSWIWAHYFNPNSLTIEQNLRTLQDRFVQDQFINDSI